MKKKKLTLREIRRLILKESYSSSYGRTPRKKKRGLADLLFEQGDAPSEDMKPATIVVLYGPPAAGKGAAKGAVGEFIGAEGGENYEEWLEAQGKEGDKYFQEEDAMMVTAMTETLPPLIFKEIHGRVAGGEDFDTVIADYGHVNESETPFPLSKLLSKSAYEKVIADNTGDDGNVDVEAAASQFADFPNTNAYFTQARGFSKEIEGAGDLNTHLGDYEGRKGKGTLGIRAAAAASYLNDVKAELKSMGADEAGDTTYAGVYLMDQAGESSADKGRVTDLIKMKTQSAPGVITLIGVYIAQPQERTELANIHRAATGGRRVASTEVDRIFDSGPQFKEDGSLDTGNLGDVIDEMLTGFDQVHVYQPEDPFNTEDADAFAAEICAPLGLKKGSLDIEGCPEDLAGPKTKARTYKGMEQQALQSAELDDLSSEEDKENKIEGGMIPSSEDLSDEQKEAIVSALGKMGFQGVDSSDLDNYLTNMGVPKARGEAGNKHGNLPSKALFGKGTNPTKKTTLKKESRQRRARKSDDEIIVERWQKLAGLIKE